MASSKKKSQSMIGIFERDIEQLKTELESNHGLSQDQRFQLLDLIGRTRDLVQEEQDRIEERLNSDFVQLYRKNIEAIVELGKRSQLAVLIFVYLLKIIDHNNAVVISQETLCEIFEVSRSTLWRGQKELEKSNFIKAIKVGTANAYVINSELVWTTYNNKKQMALFTAKVVASQSEQKPKVKTKKIKVAEINKAT